MPDIVDLIMADHEQSQKVAAVRSAMTTWAAKAAEAEHRNTIFFPRCRILREGPGTGMSWPVLVRVTAGQTHGKGLRQLSGW